MSALIEIDSIPIEKRKKMLTELNIKTLLKKGNKKYVSNQTFDVYEIINDDQVSVPFAYYFHHLSMGFPNLDKVFDKITPTFNIPLFDRQKNIRDEALQILNENRSIILSLFTGFGKCLAPDTNVLLWDGSIKHAEDIKIGDILIGDDSTPRTVLSTCKGKDMMYRITQNNGDSYIVNEPHILSLKFSDHKKWKYSESRFGTIYIETTYIDKTTMKIKHKIFENSSKIEAENALYCFLQTIPDDNTLDITIKDYLLLTDEIKNNLKGYKAKTDWPFKTTSIDPYIQGYILENNESIKRIPREFITNSRFTRLQLLAGIIDKNGCSTDNSYEILQKNKNIAEDTLYLARSLGFITKQSNYLPNMPNNISNDIPNHLLTNDIPNHLLTNNIPNNISNSLPNNLSNYSIETVYKLQISGSNINDIPCKLRTKSLITDSIDQTNPTYQTTDIKIEKLTYGDYCGFTLDKNHRFLLGDFTVTHNTVLAIYLSCKIKLKTIIICHRLILIDQWRQTLLKTCGTNTKIQILTSKSKLDLEADFYIINVTNIIKRDINDFKHIGCGIIDEIHTQCTEKYSKAFNYLFPKYLIGLTATPVRSDGKDRIIELFCGPNIIYKPLKALFNVYLYHTNFTTKPAKTENGDLDWNSVLSAQSISKNRNELLIDIIRYFRDRTILIACKRKDQVDILVKGLKKYNEDVDSFMGSDTIVNYDCRILITTYSKGTVGFDHPKLDMLLIAGDAEDNFIQCLGRVFRREWHFPIIVDPIDSFRPLKKHADTRCNVYKESGGEVKNLTNYFPCFEYWRKRFNTDLTDIYDDLNLTEEN